MAESSAIADDDERRLDSKSREGKLGRAGTARTVPESGSAGHERPPEERG
jgi:hypothetical protein